MKKLFSTILIALTIYTSSNSQDSKNIVKWGPEQEGSKRGSISGFLGADQANIYVYGTANGDDMVIKLDTNLKEIGTYVFQEKNPVTNNKYTFKSWAYLNNKLSVLKLLKGPGKSVSLYAEEINKKTMQASGTEKLIRTTESKLVSGVVTKDELREMKLGNFTLVLSKNCQYIAVCNPVFTKKNDNETFHVTVCDSTFKIIWEKEITVPYTNKLFTIIERDIDDSGNLFIRGTLDKKGDEKEKHEQDFVTHLIAYTNQGANNIDYEIKLPKLFVTEMSFDLLKNNDIAVVGLYRNGDSRGANGTFYMLLDSKDKTPKVNTIEPFGVEFLAAGKSKKTEDKLKKKDAKDKDLELSENYEITNIISDNAGGILLIGECSFMEKYPYSSGGTTYYHYGFNYNDIFLINYSSSGKIDWSTMIAKRQYSYDDGGKYSSYNLSSTDSSLRFIFNDNADNLQPKKQGDWAHTDFKGNDGIVSLVTVDLKNKGAYTREAIIKTSALAVRIVPLSCDEIDEKRMLLFGEKNKVDQFGILYFK